MPGRALPLGIVAHCPRNLFLVLVVLLLYRCSAIAAVLVASWESRSGSVYRRRDLESATTKSTLGASCPSPFHFFIADFFFLQLPIMLASLHIFRLYILAFF